MTRTYTLENHIVTSCTQSPAPSPLYREAVVACFAIGTFFAALAFAYIAF